MSRKELLLPVLSALLGLLSVAALMRLSTGIPAVAFGFLGLRRLNALPEDAGSLLTWGRRLAIGGMVGGAVGCVLGLIALIALVMVRLGESGRQTACANNLRQIGQAVKLYQVQHGEYPRAVVRRPLRAEYVMAPWLGEPYATRLSWLADVLPFLDATQRKNQGQLTALFQSLDRERAWDAAANATGINTPLRLFLCPSHPSFDPARRPPLTYYVGSAGVGANAVDLPRGSNDAGFFGYERRLTLNDLVAGESHTLLATETTLDNGPWAAGGVPTVRDFDEATRPWIGPARPFGGLHPGGANLLIADGSVRFFTVQGSEVVLRHLATVNDEALPEPP